MKHLLIFALVGIFASPISLAGEYQLAATRQAACDLIGNVGVISHKMKTDGKPKRVLVVPKPQADGGEDAVSVLVNYAINYGYDKASSASEARMMPWAVCMDKFSKE